MPEKHPSARAEFQSLSEAEVRGAIAQDDDGVVSAEVTRLAALYTIRFNEYAALYANIPPHIMYVQARCPIERVAVGFLVECVEAEGAMRTIQ